MLDPYTGVTDLPAHMVNDALGVFNEHKKPGSRRRLHVGPMMSYKTLYGLPSSWTGVFPKNKDITQIFFSDETYNCLHYADYDNHANLSESLKRALLYGGPNIHALQLDMIWPDPKPIAHAVHASRKRVEVILQVGRRALEEIDNDPNKMLSKLADYNGVIQRVLLDKSMGHGQPMVEAELRPFVEILYERMPHLGVVIAGGLGPFSMDLVGNLPKDFPDLSGDAQSNLRPSGDAHDPISWSFVKAYLIESAKRFD